MNRGFLNLIAAGFLSTAIFADRVNAQEYGIDIAGSRSQNSASINVKAKALEPLYAKIGVNVNENMPVEERNLQTTTLEGGIKYNWDNFNLGSAIAFRIYPLFESSSKPEQETPIWKNEIGANFKFGDYSLNTSLYREDEESYYNAMSFSENVSRRLVDLGRTRVSGSVGAIHSVENSYGEETNTDSFRLGVEFTRGKNLNLGLYREQRYTFENTDVVWGVNCTFKF